jgi:hypothetical protein
MAFWYMNGEENQIIDISKATWIGKCMQRSIKFIFQDNEGICFEYDDSIDRDNEFSFIMNRLLDKEVEHG